MTVHRKRYLPVPFNPRNDPRWFRPGSYPILPPGLVFPTGSPAFGDRWSWLALAVMADCSGRGVLDLETFKRQVRWGSRDAEVDQSARRPIHRLVCAGLATTYVVDDIEFFELPWPLYAQESYAPGVDVDAKRWPSWIPAPSAGELTDGMGGDEYLPYSPEDHPELWRAEHTTQVGIPDSELDESTRRTIDWMNEARGRQLTRINWGDNGDKHLAAPPRVSLDWGFERDYIKPLAERGGVWPGPRGMPGDWPLWLVAEEAEQSHRRDEPRPKKRPEKQRPAREAPPVGGPEQEVLFEISNESKEGGEKSA